jgi:hypothetical protein
MSVSESASTGWLHMRSKRRRVQRSWWGSLRTGDRIAVIGVVVAAIAAIPSFIVITSSKDGPQVDGAGSHPTITAVPRPTIPVDRKSALQITAKYNWTVQSMMWAFSGQLSPEVRQRLEQPQYAINNFELVSDLLERDGGVKIGRDAEHETDFVDLRIVVIGRHSSPVIITGMRAHILSRRPPLSGTLVWGPPEGVEENIQLGFDLDASNPIARRLDARYKLADPYFSRKHISLKRDEQAVFQVQAFAKKCYCEWEIVVEAYVEGKEQNFVVKDGIRPFRATATTSSYGTIYDFDFFASRFVRKPPGTKFEDLGKQASP